MSNLIACHGCDLLVDVGGLEDGCRADCPRCGHFLTRYKNDAMERILAFSIAALILLIVALAFPFLSFSSSGIESVMTLAAAPGSLWRYDMHSLGVMVAIFIIVMPAILLLLLVSIALPLLMGRPAPWLRLALRAVSTFHPWAMVEVFIIGVIVSLVKIAAMATVVLGISFWAYTAFSIVFTLAMANLDRYQCWELIDRLESPA